MANQRPSYDLLRNRGPLYLDASDGAAFPIDPTTDRVKAKTFTVQPDDNFVMLNEAAASGRNGEGYSFAGGTIDVTLSQVLQWFKPPATDDGSRPTVHATLIAGGMGTPEYTAADVGQRSKLVYDAVDYACDSNPMIAEKLQESCTQNEFQRHQLTGIRGNLVFEFNKESGGVVMLENAKASGYSYEDVGPQLSSAVVDTVNDSTLYGFDVNAVSVSYTSSASATESEILTGLADAVNAEAALSSICTAEVKNGAVWVRGVDLTTTFTLTNAVSDLTLKEDERAALGYASLGSTSSAKLVGFFNWTWSLESVAAEPITHDSTALQSVRISMAVEVTEQDGPGGDRGVAEIDLTIASPISVQLVLKNKQGQQNWIHRAQAGEFLKFQATITDPADADNSIVLGEKNNGIYMQLGETPTLSENGNWEFAEINASTVYPEATPGDLAPAVTYNTMFSIAFLGAEA